MCINERCPWWRSTNSSIYKKHILTFSFLFSHMQKVISMKKKSFEIQKTDLRFQVKLVAEARKSFQSEHVWISQPASTHVTLNSLLSPVVSFYPEGLP